MAQAFRFELKFLLDPFAYHRVRNSLAGYIRRDRYSSEAPGGRYLVRSLYFDTADYRAYREKITGETIRNKLRMRTYTADRGAVEFVNIEQKQRYGKLISKLVTRASIGQYDAFLRGRTWGGNEDTILMDFERLVRLDNLKPKVVVEYFREAYSARDGSGVRVSFDHDIRFARTGDLFAADARYVSDLAGMVVFEIKTASDNIGWLCRLVRQQDLKAVPNSKYAGAIEQTQLDIWY